MTVFTDDDIHRIRRLDPDLKAGPVTDVLRACLERPEEHKDIGYGAVDLAARLAPADPTIEGLLRGLYLSPSSEEKVRRNAAQRLSIDFAKWGRPGYIEDFVGHADAVVAGIAIRLMCEQIIDGFSPRLSQATYIERLYHRDVGISAAAAAFIGLQLPARQCAALLIDGRELPTYEEVAAADACLHAKTWHPDRSDMGVEEVKEMPPYSELDARSISFLDRLKSHILDADPLILRRVLAAYANLQQYAEHCEAEICDAIQQASDDTVQPLLKLLLFCDRDNPQVRSLIAGLFSHPSPLIRLDVLYAMLVGYTDWPVEFPKILAAALCDKDDEVAFVAFKALSDDPAAVRHFHSVLKHLLAPDRIGSVNPSIVEWLPEVISQKKR